MMRSLDKDDNMVAMEDGSDEMEEEENPWLFSVDERPRQTMESFCCLRTFGCAFDSTTTTTTYGE